MPDYKEMYLKMVRAAEEAQRILIKAQQECEEIYLSASDSGKEDSSLDNSRRFLGQGMVLL